MDKEKLLDETEREELIRLRKFYNERIEEDIELLKKCLNLLVKTTSKNQVVIEKHKKEIDELKSKLKVSKEKSLNEKEMMYS